MDQGATMWKYDLELTADATSASSARSFVGQRLAEHELQYLADDVQLVVSELATNALRDALTPFTVTLAAVAESLLVKVREGRRATRSALMALPSTLPVAESPSWLYSAATGAVTAHADGGKTVWAAFDPCQVLDLPLGSTESVPVS